VHGERSASDTALMVCASLFLASAPPRPLLVDPWAERVGDDERDRRLRFQPVALTAVRPPVAGWP
jgi:hypothetical protein